MGNAVSPMSSPRRGHKRGECDNLPSASPRGGKKKSKSEKSTASLPTSSMDTCVVFRKNHTHCVISDVHLEHKKLKKLMRQVDSMGDSPGENKYKGYRENRITDKLPVINRRSTNNFPLILIYGTIDKNLPVVYHQFPIDLNSSISRFYWDLSGIPISFEKLSEN